MQASTQAPTPIIPRPISDYIRKDKSKNIAVNLLLKMALSTINHMASDFCYRDELCHYCIHFPMGGDGQWGVDKDGACNFRWRFADEIERIMEQEG